MGLRGVLKLAAHFLMASQVDLFFSINSDISADIFSRKILCSGLGFPSHFVYLKRSKRLGTGIDVWHMNFDGCA